jgi:predicted Zn-dependent peptidase
MYQVTELENGLRVATARMPHMSSISIGFWVGVGSRFEPKNLSGVSHFIEHLLFKGTPRRSSLKITQDVEGIGGDLNAFTSEESTCYYSKAKYDRYESLLDVLMDMYLNAELKPVEIRKEREVIKDELRMYMDQPHHYVQEILNEVTWPEQPMGRLITGSMKSLESIKRKQLSDFIRTHYLANNTVITAAGPLQHKQFLKSVSQYAKHFRRGSLPKFESIRNHAKGPHIRILKKETEQTQLALGVQVCYKHEEERFPLRVLNTLLGENMSSRLFQNIRENKGLAYSVNSSVSLFEDVGQLVITAGVDAENLEKTLRLIVKELRRFVLEKPKIAEIRRAQEYLIGQLDLNLESTGNRMMWLGEQLLSYGELVPKKKIIDRIQSVTAKNIQTVSKQFFKTERLCLSVIGPIRKDLELRSSLIIRT